MKKFVFRFEKILQLRIDKENEVRNSLGKVNQVILEREEALKQTEHQYEVYLNELNDKFKNGIYVRDMQSVSGSKQFLIDKMNGIKQELSVLMEERRNIQKMLIEANKQRKIMEKLKEKELDNYKVLEAQEEAKVVDQIVTYQSTNRKGE